METASKWYYICDACGNLVTIESAPIADDSGWECDECGSSALWEFTNKTNALAHAEHIKSALRTGLFRRTRS